MLNPFNNKGGDIVLWSAQIYELCDFYLSEFISELLKKKLFVFISPIFTKYVKRLVDHCKEFKYYSKFRREIPVLILINIPENLIICCLAEQRYVKKVSQIQILPMLLFYNRTLRQHSYIFLNFIGF